MNAFIIAVNFNTLLLMILLRSLSSFDFICFLYGHLILVMVQLRIILTVMAAPALFPGIRRSGHQ